MDERRRATPLRGADEEKKGANAMMAAGVGIGALGVATAAIGAAVCPVCVVAAPALLGLGAYRRWRCTRTANGAKKGG